MNFQIPGASLHHVALTVNDYERSRDFYLGAFGMTLVNEWTFNGRRLCFLDVGDGSFLELHSALDAAPADGRYLHFCIHTSDIDAAYENALARGAAPNRAPFDFLIESAPHEMPVRVAWLFGPDGEGIELFQHVGKRDVKAGSRQ